MRDLTGRDDVLRDSRQMTSRMDELQAAILRTKLPHLPVWIAQRKAAAAWYAANLPQTVRIVSRDPRDLQHLFVIRARDRDGLMNHLGRLGIETKIHFPTPLYRQAAPWGKPGQQMPRADDWCASVLSLPCFPGIEERELRYVATAVEQCYPA
jgi:dTDP-4-amino-4,6-dideoxygalactose transaminase